MSQSLLQQLTPLHGRAMELRLQGLKYHQIADEVRRSEQTIKRWFTDPSFSEEYQRLCEERKERARAIIFEAAPQAAETIRTLMTGRSEMVKLLAAKDILDRSGLKPVEKIDQNTSGETQITVKYVDQDLDGRTAESTSGPAALDSGEPEI